MKPLLNSAPSVSSSNSNSSCTEIKLSFCLKLIGNSFFILMVKKANEKKLFFLFAQSGLCMLNHTQKSKRHFKERVTFFFKLTISSTSQF